MVIAVIMDIREWRISNRLITLGLFTGLILRIVGEGSIGIIYFLVNISIPVILLFLLFQLRALGAGDIKLFSVVGGFVEREQLLEVIVISFLAAAFMGVGKMLYLKLSNIESTEKKTLIHFSIAILIGYIVTIWRCAIG